MAKKKATRERMGKDDSLLIDVRSREEYVKEHADGSLNIPLYDLVHYVHVLEGRTLKLYCNTERRAGLAKDILNGLGLDGEIVPYGRTGKKVRAPMICAMNFLEIRPEHEAKVHDILFRLCKAVDAYPGFLGSKVMKVTGASPMGSMLPGKEMDEDFSPLRYVLITYWASKEIHEASHRHPEFQRAFTELPAYLSKMPYEEFCEILR
ncbi:MAG: sulfur oxygenase reductase family protein [Methanobacteriota archaeon]